LLIRAGLLTYATIDLPSHPTYGMTVVYNYDQQLSHRALTAAGTVSESHRVPF